MSDAVVRRRCMCTGTRCDLMAPDPRHGTSNGYTNLYCRCEPCRAANTIALYQQRAARIARGVPAHVHGTAGGYGNWGCRCTPCTAAWAKDTNDRKKRRQRGETLCATGQAAKPKRRPR